MFSKILPITISRQGVYLKVWWNNYPADTLFFTWGNLFGLKGFHSTRHNIFFPRYSLYSYLNKYELEGNHPEKLQSFNLTTVLAEWVAQRYPMGNVIVLSNVNVAAKNIEFWAKVPVVSRGHFNKDLVVLICQDYSETKQLFHNLPEDFADAYAFLTHPSGRMELLRNEEHD